MRSGNRKSAIAGSPRAGSCRHGPAGQRDRRRVGDGPVGVLCQLGPRSLGLEPTLRPPRLAWRCAGVQALHARGAPVGRRVYVHAALQRKGAHGGHAVQVGAGLGVEVAAGQPRQSPSSGVTPYISGTSVVRAQRGALVHVLKLRQRDHGRVGRWR